jgi:hypothetical protein
MAAIALARTRDRVFIEGRTVPFHQLATKIIIAMDMPHWT